MPRRHSPTLSTMTSDFRREFEAETVWLLRRRFLWFAGLVGAISGAFVLRRVFGVLVGAADAVPWAELMVSLAQAAMFIGVFEYTRRARPGRDRLLALTLWLVVLHCGLSIAVHMAAVRGLVAPAPVSAPAWLHIMSVHVLASVFLPWTPRESARPIVPLLALYALSLLAAPVPWVVKLAVIGLVPLIGVPGVLVAWIRHSRRMQDFTLRFFQHRYGEVRRELVNARSIHEALFPGPIEHGPIRMRYRYEPMRQIGGDYLFASSPRGEPGVLNLVILDVTGHGIPAALTVNRLHGELERVYAEDPDARPGRVLALLNRYVHLTLARHSVYATALCIRIDAARDELEYASAGHPPAFLRGVDGTVRELASTALVLGATPDEGFDPAPIRAGFGPGDTLIGYTDGATEARDARGAMFGIERLRRLVASANPRAQGALADTIVRAVDRHRSVAPSDDTLVVEVTRPLSPGEPVRRGGVDMVPEPRVPAEPARQAAALAATP